MPDHILRDAAAADKQEGVYRSYEANVLVCVCVTHGPLGQGTV